MLSTEPSKKIGELSQQAHPAKGGDQHALAGVPLENDGFVAVDPFACAPADLDGRELVKRDPQPLRSTRPVEDECMIAELEPATRGRAVTGAPDDGIVVRTRANAFGRQSLLL
jgi:hypothetical protein